MEHAAACLYGAKSAFSPVLWKPALFWAADAVRAAGLDAGVLPENDDAAKAAAAKLPVWDAAALAGACDGAKDLLLLRGDLALVGADSIRAAYDAHKANQNDLTAFCCPDTGDAPAAWVRTAALPAALPTEPGFPLPALLLRLQAAGARIQRLAAPVASAALCADTAGNRHLLTEAARRQILAALLDAGVEIPAADGVLVGPDVTVEAGATLLPGTILRGNTHVGAGAVLGPNTLLEDCDVGENARLNSTQGYSAKILPGANIGPFVHIRPNSIIGENVHLGNFVEVKNSSIDTGTKVSHLTYVGDSDVGKRVNFGCGTVTVNYTGKAKFRTTIGDDAFIGCNTNLVAPVCVGEGAYTAAGSTITDDVPADALGIARARQVNKEGWSRRFLADKKK